MISYPISANGLVTLWDGRSWSRHRAELTKSHIRHVMALARLPASERHYLHLTTFSFQPNNSVSAWIRSMPPGLYPTNTRLQSLRIVIPRAHCDNATTRSLRTYAETQPRRKITSYASNGRVSHHNCRERTHRKPGVIHSARRSVPNAILVQSRESPPYIPVGKLFRPRFIRCI